MYLNTDEFLHNFLNNFVLKYNKKLLKVLNKSISYFFCDLVIFVIFDYKSN